MTTSRAIDETQKLARKTTLMQSGWELFIANDGQLPSVAQVVKKAGVAKGTFYLYFTSKEDLFMELLARAVSDFFAQVQQHLNSQGFEIAGFTEHFVKRICDDDVMVHLSHLISDIIDKNTEATAATQFKLEMVKYLFQIGSLIETSIEQAIAEGTPYQPIKAGGAARLLLRSYAAFIGIAQMLPTPGNPILEIKELKPIRLELAKDTRAIISAIWRDALQTDNTA